MQPYVGLTLLLASVTCLQGYVRWDLFVLGAQPLEMSSLSLCQHNKTLLPAKLPQCPISQLEIPTFLGGLSGIAQWLDTSLVTRDIPGVTGIPRTARRSHQAPMDSLIWWNPVRHKNQRGEGSAIGQTGKNLGSNSGLPQEAEGETDHLPEPATNHILGVKPCLSGSGSNV
jgi:hypothetical protein